ncbi:MAG: DTW domain-containing protein [Deltaproteobacteria bacterium]|nr:DTW domain-containing protein [Deltaproteobacteria bacterium]
MRCQRCLQPICICAAIPAIATRTRVVVLRHFSETNRSSNSGRLAHLALPNSEMIDHGVPHAPIDAAQLAQPGTWLVFPEGEPWHAAPSPPPARIIVLDATWAQARRMRQRAPGLRGLPVLRLPDAEAPAARLRAAPAPGLVSTIEAIARALRLLEGEAPARALEQLFTIVVDQARALGRPLPPG